MGQLEPEEWQVGEGRQDGEKKSNNFYLDPFFFLAKKERKMKLQETKENFISKSICVSYHKNSFIKFLFVIEVTFLRKPEMQRMPKASSFSKCVCTSIT